MKTLEQERQDAISKLKEYVKEGDTLYTDVKHVSKSGMTRHMKVIQLQIYNKKARPSYWHYYIAKALNLPMNRDNQVIVRGCGMDMGFHLINSLSRTLYGKGDAIKHEWL